jgi:hypothetical protein
MGTEQGARGGGGTEIGFASGIVAALHRSLGSTRGGVQTAAGWTGANEKTVKNWSARRYGRSGQHLIHLARHSDDVLSAFLEMAGRDHLLVGAKLVAAENAIAELLVAVRRLGGNISN